MTTIRLIIAIVILIFALAIVVMNWGCMIVNRRNKKRGVDRHHSTVPIVSFVLAALAYLLYPRPVMSWMFAIPLLDIANWRLLWLPVALIRQARTKEKD
jgi:NADH:ubiquinone oxidoreductase subunit 6 (subunit J)